MNENYNEEKNVIKTAREQLIEVEKELMRRDIIEAEANKMYKLTVLDYINQPLIELSQHPDFDLEVFQVIANLVKMVPSKYEYWAPNFRRAMSTL